MTDSPLQLDPFLLDLLCCPQCKDQGRLELDNAAGTLQCSACHNTYRLRKVAGVNAQGMLLPDLISPES